MMALAATVFGIIVMGLWNALVPELFHGPAIGFWQAVGLVVLSHLLFRGMGDIGYKAGFRRGRWRQKFEAKLEAMTPEEREKFRAEYARRCGWKGSHSDENNKDGK